MLYVTLHCLGVPPPWGPLYRGVLHFCEVQMAVSTAKLVVSGPVDLTHSEKFPLHQRHLKTTKCWTRDIWMLVGPLIGVTPLAPL